jgi:CheY-like chemotaxis protein
MDPNIRPPPCILILHNGRDLGAHVQHLRAAGLSVVDAHLDGNPVETVLSAHPDVIVLDFEIDGDTVELIKDDSRTRHIPIIALAELAELAEINTNPGQESGLS